MEKLSRYSIVIFLVLGLTYLSTAQDTIKVFYNQDWQICDSTNYHYFRIGGIDPNTLKWNGVVCDYYMTDTLLMKGYYVNGGKEGPFYFYFENGVLDRKGTYKHNKRKDAWSYYYEDGSPKQEVIFLETEPDALVGYNFSVLEYYNEKGEHKIKEGNGKWENTFTTSSNSESNPNNSINSIRVVGSFRNGKKHSIWKSYRSDNSTMNWDEWFKDGVYRPTFSAGFVRKHEMMEKFPDDKYASLKSAEDFELDTVIYNNGLLYGNTESILTAITGKSYEIQYRQAGYPQGDYDLLNFIGRNIKYPPSARNNGIEGTVYISITIDKYGKPINRVVLESAGAELDKEALRVIDLIQEWMPALQFGEPVQSSITIPVSFNLN